MSRYIHRICTRISRLPILTRRSRAAEPPRTERRDEDFVFRPDGSIVNLRGWHRRYHDADLSDAQCRTIEDHLLFHRRDRSLWDALSLEEDRVLCERLLGRPVEDLWVAELMGKAPRHKHDGGAHTPPSSTEKTERSLRKGLG